MAELNPLILANLIRNWCEKEPQLQVLTFVAIDEGGNFREQTRTYQQLWDNGQRLAAWLKLQGIQRGDAFALVMQNHAEFVDFMVASSIVGSVFVPIDSRTRGAKLGYMLDFAECKGAVVGDDALPAVQAAWRDQPGKWIATLGAGSDIHAGVAQALSAAVPEPPIEIASTDPEAPMQLLYTSGTTGDPKAIMSTHSRYGIAATLPTVLGLSREDCLYTGLSLTHANAQLVTLGMVLHAGIPGVISLKFTKSRLWDITRKYGCSFFNLLGGMTTAIYAEPARPDDADNPVRMILSAGMPAAIWQSFSARFGVELFEFYGAAEGGLCFNPTGVGPIGSCGKAAPSLEMAILDEHGEAVAAGLPGEICFREADGRCPSLTYFKNPEATAKKTAGGWLHMGDIGHMDENGWLFFHYRMGGGIRKNGDFINAAFIEKALSEIDTVADVYVYGLAVSDSLAPGEKDIVAAVVPTGSTTPDISGLFDACRQTLGRNSVPDFIQLLEEIPKTASEKPQERFLVEAFKNNPTNVYPAMNIQKE